MTKRLIVLAGVLMLISPLALSAQTIPGGQGIPLIEHPTAQININGTLSGDEIVNTKIEPFSKNTLQRDTRVLFNNNSDVPVNIVFTIDSKPAESKLASGGESNCKRMAGSPQQTQYWQFASCYVIEKPIPPRGSLEIRFDSQGQYSYLIEYMGTKTTATGQLDVF